MDVIGQVVLGDLLEGKVEVKRETFGQVLEFSLEKLEKCEVEVGESLGW